VIAGDTGIPLSTRLQSFVMTPGHANQLAPGKRPRVTLSPTVVLKDGNPYFIMSTPGGDNQDQALLQVLLKIDHQINDAHRFSGSYFLFSGSNTVKAGTGNLPWANQEFSWRQHNLNLSV
jgi:gamma-glutamyltranspeptidase